VKPNPALGPPKESAITCEESETGEEVEHLLRELQALPPTAPRRVEVLRKLIALVDPNEPVARANLQHHLGGALIASRGDDEAANIEEALGVLQEALGGFTPEAFPAAWCSVHYMLGTAFALRPGGNRADDVERAIGHLTTSLGRLPPESDPELHEVIQRNLGYLYLERAPAGSVENVRRAVGHLEAALSARNAPPSAARTEARHHLASLHLALAESARASGPDASLEDMRRAAELIARDAEPEWWARTQHNLGEAYIALREADAIEHAITHLTRALEVFTPEAHPVDCGIAENSLGVAFLTRFGGDREDDIERGIEHLRKALALRPRRRFPAYWARTQANLGSAFRLRVRGDPDANRDRAIAHFTGYLSSGVSAQSLLERGGMLSQLAVLWLDRKRGDDAENRAKATANAEAALALLRLDTDPAGYAEANRTLARALVGGGEVTGAEFERVIRHYDASLDERLLELEPRRWAQTQQEVALLYDGRREGDLSENQGIALVRYQQALRGYQRANAPLGVAMTHHWIASLLREQHADGDPDPRLERAVAHHRQAVAALPPDGPPGLRATVLQGLGNALYRQAAGARDERLEEAIPLYEAALECLPASEPDERRALLHTMLGIVLLERPGGRATDNVEAALAHQYAALQIWTREASPTAWARTQHNLGTAFAGRIHGSRAENIEAAIRCFQAALEVFVREEHPSDWALSQASLGVAYTNRVRGERADNLETAIDHLYAALDVFTPTKHAEDWGMTLHNLGTAYLRRVYGAREANVRVAIRNFEDALTVRTRTAAPHFWAMTQTALGIASSLRSDGDPATNTAEALHHLQTALEVYTRESHPMDWAWVQLSLGGVWSDAPEPEPLERLSAAVECYEAALTVYSRAAHPERWASTLNNLALAHRARARAGREEDGPEAVRCLERALEVFTPEHHPSQCRGTLANLGDAYRGSQDWQRALDCYEKAISVGGALLEGAYTEPGRQAEAGDTASVYTRAAWCLLRLDRPGESLARLEAGRARLLSETLAVDDADLAELPSDVAVRVRDARRSVRALEDEMRTRDADVQGQVERGVLRVPELLPLLAPGEHSAQTITLRELRAALADHGLSLGFAEMLQSARRELAEALRTARDVHPTFLHQGLDVPGILAQVPPGGALVALMLTREGSEAWVVPDHAVAVRSEDTVLLRPDVLDRLLELLRGEGGRAGWVAAYRAWHTEGATERWSAVIESTTRQLWDLLMQPIHARLTALGMAEGAPVVLMVPAEIGLLPLHAAWREVGGAPRAFLDDFRVSYVPSLHALQVANQRIASPTPTAKGLLAVVDPTGDLPYAEGEGASLEALFPVGDRQVLCGAEATVDAVVPLLSDRRYVHFACHGTYDWQDVMRSGLALAGRTRLTLSGVLSPDVDLEGTRLVVLSACETGLTDLRLARSEHLGLPTGFLLGGAPGVVGASWAVSDVSTGLLFEQFYRLHLVERLSPAAALRGAQLWLRDGTAEQLQLAERWGRVYEASDPPDPAAFRLMRHYRAQPQSKPYASPFYWAAFTLTGA
jgi:CHAT domain-containing protein/tetratricopeptide (TPR) repeat protein